MREPITPTRIHAARKTHTTQVLPDFAMHFFTSGVTPEGPVPVDQWVSYWKSLHGGFDGERSESWDAFMWNSQARVTSAPSSPHSVSLSVRGVTSEPYYVRCRPSRRGAASVDGGGGAEETRRRTR